MVRACVLLCSKVDFYHLLPFGVRSPLSLTVALLWPLSRFLEASGCASVCVHTCKAPTQEFFNQDMGVPMRMLPDYASYECVFEFGVAPTAADDAEARSAPCLVTCPAPKRPIPAAGLAVASSLCMSKGSSSS